MSDPTNKAGITKNSTLIVDIPGYPPTSSQKQLNLVANTTSIQTIYPPTGEYWNSIKYSVNVPNQLTISKRVRIRGLISESWSSYFSLVYHQNSESITLYQNYSYVYIINDDDHTEIYFMAKIKNDQTFTLENNTWLGSYSNLNDGLSLLYLYKYNGTNSPTEVVLSLRDVSGGGDDGDNDYWSNTNIQSNICKITIQ
jgi:hypothetical protein